MHSEQFASLEAERQTGNLSAMLNVFDILHMKSLITGDVDELHVHATDNKCRYLPTDVNRNTAILATSCSVTLWRIEPVANWQ